jgi:hypothetical protein
MKIEDYCQLFQGTTLSASPVGSMPIQRNGISTIQESNDV